MRSTHPRFGCFLSRSCSPFLPSTSPPRLSRAPGPRAPGPLRARSAGTQGSLPSTLTAGCSGSQASGTPQTNFWS
ncbi:Dysferlin [Manis pentadactyla]|nr:Dysferlin [Manis pentadactyla]